MPRFVKPLAIGCLGLSATLVVASAYVGWKFLSVQPIQIIDTNGGVLVDIQSLGEYQANLNRLKLTERNSGEVIWEVKAKKDFNPVWTIPLVAGENPAHPEILSLSEVLVPSDGSTFVLAASTSYILETWSLRDLGESHRVVEFEIRSGRQP